MSSIIEYISSEIDRISNEAIQLSRMLFENPEISGNEYFAMHSFLDYMDTEGFKCERSVYGVSTAFVCKWGVGNSPVVGFIAEYDALPGLNQVGGSPMYNGDSSKPGHGCGHNLLGSGCALAAIALKNCSLKYNFPVQIVLYGCPSEELLKGKIDMAKNGAFRDLDIALSWHPFDSYRTSNTVCQAMDSLIFKFYGKSSHAAAAPHLGRSALDACELMNVGVNYLREHITDGERIHYSYESCGNAPNIVPDFASTKYFIRGSRRSVVSETTDRVIDIARGAALMTGTTMEYEYLTRGYETLVNHTIANEFYKIMNSTSFPTYDKDEIQFASILSEHSGCQPYFADCIDNYSYGQVVQAFGSSDFSDVSQLVPSGTFRSACFPVGTPNHHWATTSCSGFSVGEKGMIYASKVLAQAGYWFATNPVLLKKATDEFNRTSHGWWT